LPYAGTIAVCFCCFRFDGIRANRLPPTAPNNDESLSDGSRIIRSARRRVTEDRPFPCTRVRVFTVHVLGPHIIRPEILSIAVNIRNYHIVQMYRSPAGAMFVSDYRSSRVHVRFVYYFATLLDGGFSFVPL